MRLAKIRPRFVEFIPDQLEEGVLYISERFRTCSHKCCCGCGEEVVTPLSVAEWRLTREGDLVSLWPSVGNWDYACRSHYVIQRNQVKWAATMTNKQIARVQQRDASDLARMVASGNAAKSGEERLQNALSKEPHVPSAAEVPPGQTDAEVSGNRPSVVRQLLRLLFGSRPAD